MKFYCFEVYGISSKVHFVALNFKYGGSWINWQSLHVCGLKDDIAEIMLNFKNSVGILCWHESFATRWSW